MDWSIIFLAIAIIIIGSFIGYVFARISDGLPLFSNMSKPSIIILRRYKALPTDRLTEPVKTLKAKLKELDKFYGATSVNNKYICNMYSNTFMPVSFFFNSDNPMGEYDKILMAVGAIERAAKAERDNNKPSTYYIVKSLTIDAEQIERGTR